MAVTRAESIAILKDLHAQADWYARDTDSHIGSPMANLPFNLGVNSFAAMAAKMNFTDGSGFQVADGTLSWKTWAGQLEALVAGMLEWRSANNWPPKLGGSTGDPLGQWWSDVAAKQLSTLSVGEFITDVTEPARQAASAAAGLLEYGTPLVVAVVVVLVLIIVVKVT